MLADALVEGVVRTIIRYTPPDPLTKSNPAEKSTFWTCEMIDFGAHDQVIRRQCHRVNLVKSLETVRGTPPLDNLSLALYLSMQEHHQGTIAFEVRPMTPLATFMPSLTELVLGTLDTQPIHCDDDDAPTGTAAVETGDD